MFNMHAGAKMVILGVAFSYSAEFRLIMQVIIGIKLQMLEIQK